MEFWPFSVILFVLDLLAIGLAESNMAACP
jgi:hypothetical protein